MLRSYKDTKLLDSKVMSFSSDVAFSKAIASTMNQPWMSWFADENNTHPQLRDSTWAACSPPKLLLAPMRSLSIQAWSRRQRNLPNSDFVVVFRSTCLCGRPSSNCKGNLRPYYNPFWPNTLGRSSDSASIILVQAHPTGCQVFVVLTGEHILFNTYIQI